jgi:4-hydroxythreonine-4-phosphate dehydrogenase
MNKKIIIVGGDPNSINSEIIFKSWKKINKTQKKRIYLISNFDLIQKQFNKLNYRIPLYKVKTINEKVKTNKLKILDVMLKFKEPFKVDKDLSSKYVLRSLNLAHKLGLEENVIGIINCAINKKLLKKSNTGVTEYLASKCKVKNDSEVMLIGNRKLYVSPITTHLDIRRVSSNLKKTIIINKLKVINNWYIKKLKKKPLIGILGLNPHNSELRKNSEEIKIIIPAIKYLKKMGLNLNGPLIADTLFIKNYKKFDVIIGMYHDQVIAPFKTLYKFDAINITLGLKYLRVSPDHGVALDLIGKNKANASSLVECINFINKFGK